MITVWKYPLVFGAVVPLSMPLGATVVEAAVQFGEVMLWALVDTTQFHVVRLFRITGTGHEVGPRWKHVKTCHDGPFVWHVFEVPA